MEECDAEKLLFCVENRPALYNFRMKEHCNRGIINRLWEEIGEEMELPVAECKAKWASLRNSYNRVLRDGRSSKKRKWYLTDAMEFVREFVGVHRNLANDSEDNSMNQEDAYDAEEVEYDAEKLLFCVENRPAIYNFNMKEHTDKSIVNQHWIEISQEMHLSVKQCRSKWTSLRNSYNRALREEAKGTRQRKWYLMDAMHFLREFIGGNRNNPSDDENSITQEDLYHMEDVKVSPLLINDRPTSNTRSSAKRNAAERLVVPVEFSKTEDDKEDPTVTFFRSLTPDINTLPEAKKRKFKQEVLMLLNNLLDDQENTD